MRIIGLDPSTVAIGWAVLDTADNTIIKGADGTHKIGIFKPHQNNMDMKLLDAHRWLSWQLGTWDQIKNSPIDYIVIEMPVQHRNVSTTIEMPVQHRNVSTTIKLAQMVGALRIAAYEWVREIIEVLPQERLTALGLPARMKRDAAKTAVLLRVNALYGLNLTKRQHDISDAIAVAVAGWGKIRERQLTDGV